jgi:hypothetical protein
MNSQSTNSILNSPSKIHVFILMVSYKHDLQEVGFEIETINLKKSVESVATTKKCEFNAPLIQISLILFTFIRI